MGSGHNLPADWYRGFLYPVAIMDWASPAVLAWQLSNSMDVSFCVSALEEGLARLGNPDIFNTDQGGQFASAAFTGVLLAAGSSIDGWSWPVAGQRVHRATVAIGDTAVDMTLRLDDAVASSTYPQPQQQCAA